MPLVNVKVIGRGLPRSKKHDMIQRITRHHGRDRRRKPSPVTWVVVDEVEERDWGIGGDSLTTAKVHALQGRGHRLTSSVTRVRLLGRPRHEGGRQPRGQKSWALLARVALSDRPVTRRELAH